MFKRSFSLLFTSIYFWVVSLDVEGDFPSLDFCYMALSRAKVSEDNFCFRT